MAVPGISNQADVHVDQVLTNLVIDYGQNTFIADQVLPQLTVDKDTGKFYVWERNNINITGLNTKRADRAKANEVNLDVSLDDFSMEQHALRDFLEDTIRKNADSQLQIQQSYAQNVIDLMDLVKEKEIADVIFASGSYDSSLTTTLDSTNKWSNLTHADSDPLEDVMNAKESVLLAAGVIPNTLIVGYSLAQKLRRHSKVLASVQFVQSTGARSVPLSVVKDYLELDNIIVGSAVYNSAAEGLTASNAFVWNTHAALIYTPPQGGGFRVPAFGYQMVPGHTPRTVSRYTENGLNGEWIEVNEKRKAKITFNKAGFFFENAGA